MNNQQIKAGIIGAAGYTAGELIRLLICHDQIEEIICQSGSQAGKPVTSVHTDLIGEIDLIFYEDIDPVTVDVLFLCKGHGESKKYLSDNQIPAKVKIIDLSHDFRLASSGNEFVYGLPELNRSRIEKAEKIANPGCFATAIHLGLLPAVSHDLVKGDIHTSGITGATGAGQSFSRTSHFSWRNNNVSVYKAFVHQHLAEIGESLEHVSGIQHDINFIPYRGNFSRGIITTSYFKTNAAEEQIKEAYRNYYDDHPFTVITPVNPDLKLVVNTNKALIYTEKTRERLMVITVIDNLLKGASGQAVQNMNLMFGFGEKTGLLLKSIAF